MSRAVLTFAKGGRFVKISLTKAFPALPFFLAKFQQNRVFCKVVFTFCALFSAKSRFCAGRQTTRKEKSTMFVVLCAGISPLAKIYSLCACQASLPIFERQMRTQRIRARRYAPGEIPRTGHQTTRKEKSTMFVVLSCGLVTRTGIEPMLQP